MTPNDPKPPESITTPPEAKPSATSAPVGPPTDPRFAQDFPTDQIIPDPDRFQYKIGYGKGGQSGSLTDAKSYNPEFAGVLDVWRDPETGVVHPINGHNRHALAVRTGTPGVDVRFLNAKDAAEARTKGALMNIAEGQGSALDAAKLFRENELTPADVQGMGINLKGQKAAQGLALSKLNPSLFNMTLRGEMPVERAAIIGERLPDYKDQQTLMEQVGERNVTNADLSEMADAIAHGPRADESTASLFGDETVSRSLAVERGQAASYVKTQLSQERAAFGNVSKNAGRLKKGNNVIDAEQSARIALQNKQGAELFAAHKNAPGPVADILNDAARRLAHSKETGENPDAIKTDALTAFQALIPDLAKGREAASAESAGKPTAPPEPGGTLRDGPADRAVHGQPQAASPTDTQRVAPGPQRVAPGPDLSSGLLFGGGPEDLTLTAPKEAKAAVKKAAPVGMGNESMNFGDAPPRPFESDPRLPPVVRDMIGRAQDQGGTLTHAGRIYGDATDNRIALHETQGDLEGLAAQGHGAIYRRNSAEGETTHYTSSADGHDLQVSLHPDSTVSVRVSPRGEVSGGMFGAEASPAPRVPAGAHGSPIKDLDAPARPNPTPAMTRIQPEPIAGGQPKRLSQIVLDLSKSTGRKVGVAKLPRGVAGTYFPGSAKTSIRFAGDLDTTAHEIAHALDDRHGLVAAWNKPRAKSPYDAELRPFWESGGSATKSGPRSRLAYKRAEGVAEFTRAYIVNPDAAKKAAPNFHAHFVSTVPADTLAKIHAFSKDVREFAGLPASEKIGANINMDARGPSLTQALKTHLKGEGWDFETTGLDRLQAAAQDSLKPFTKAVQAARQVAGRTSLLPADDPIVLARTHSGSGGKVLNILDRGMIDAQGGRVTPGGIDWLLEPLDKSTHENLTSDMEDTVRLMTAQRTLEKATQTGRQRVTGIGGGLYDDPSIAHAALKEFDADPARLARLEEGADRYRQWADGLLKYQVQKGRMSQAAYDAVKADNDYYVALQREMDKITPPRAGSGNSGSKLGSAKQTVHAFKGSTREIQNPYRSLIDQTQAMVKEADRNEVLRAFRDMLTTQRGMYQGDVRNLSAIGHRAKVGDDNTVRIFVDGKAEYWQFEKGVYETLKGFGSELQLPKISTFLPALMRGAVTHDPGFLVRNVFRDAIDRTLLSKHGGKPWDVIGKTGQADRDAFALSGGGQAGHYLVSKEGYGKALETAMRHLSQDRNSVTALPGDFLEKYQHLAHSSEMVGRYAEYKKAFAHAKGALGYDDYNAGLYAANEARGLMDFAVAGNVGRVVNQYLPFTNAALQGTTNLLKAARANPGAFLGRWAAYVVVPELAVYAWNMSQGKATRDEYRQLPAYQRDMFYNLKVGPDTWLRIPKGFEMATLASGVSRTIDKIAGNPTAFEGYTGSLAKSFIPVDEQAFAGPMRPVVENMANYDFFRGSTIVPPYEDKLRLDLRKGAKNGTRLGQAVGKVLGSDPRKVDHFIRAQFGGVGGVLGQVSNIGRADRPVAALQAGMALPGLLTGSPAINAPDVQQVMNISQQLGKPDPLKEALSAYQTARTPAEREAAGRALRDQAHALRPGLEAEDNKPAALLRLIGGSRRRPGLPHRPGRPHR